MRTAATVLLILGLGLTSRPAAWALTLADDGRTDYEIVLSADEASPSEKYAAGELAHFLQQITGATFPIHTDRESTATRRILLGDSGALHKLAPALDLRPLGREGYVIKTLGDDLILAGGRQRGTLYAVYGLLEDHLGCHWFTPDCSTIPPRKRLELGPLDERRVPALEYREDFYAEGFDGVWAARNRMNGNAHRLTPEQGDKVRYIGFVHTFNALVPPDKYFASHPEYYSMIGGKRTAQNAQLCLTNPEVVRIATQTVREWLRDARQKGLPEDPIVSVSQNDCWGYCECPQCKALAEREGSQSGPILHFVNQIADAVKDEFPLAAIDTLAYSYSRKPPLHVKPRPNVIVRLCSIECCFSHALETCPVNKTFMDDLRGWSKICKRLYVWDYVTNFAHYVMPFPNLRVLAPNIRAFVAHNVRGIFEEGNYHGGGEFCHLRTYLLAKLLWDPDCDLEAARNEFLATYYGPASIPLLAYIRLMHDTVEREDVHVHIYSPPTQPHLRPEVLAQANALFDRAEAVVKLFKYDEVRLRRVRHARMPLMYVSIAGFDPGYRIQGDRIVPTGGQEYTDALARFAQLATDLGVPRISEGQDMEPWLKARPTQFPTLSIVRIQSKNFTAEVIPELGGRLFRLYDRCLYRNLVWVPPPGDRGFPSLGGCTVFPGESWPGPGSADPWRVVNHERYRVTLQREVEGLDLRQTLALDPAKPLVTLTVEAKNALPEPRDTLVRLHPQFRLGKADDCLVHLASRAGRSPVRLADCEGAEPNLFLQGDDLPAGAWSLENLTYHYAITATFDPSEVSQCLLNFHRQQNRVNMELYSQRRVLKPGESLRVQYQWAIVRNTADERAGIGPADFGRWGF